VAERETILAVLQSDIGIAALILVFAGFLLTKSETYQTKLGDKYRGLVKSDTGRELLKAISAGWRSALLLSDAYSHGR
jgi:hypothetical protein